MLRYSLFAIHAAELLLYTWLLHDFGREGPFDWLIEVVGLALLVRLIIITLTFIIARTPLRPTMLAFSALAAEYYATVYLFSYAIMRSVPSVARPTTADANQLPIIFVHGFVCNSGFWRRYIARFQKSWGGNLATVDLEPLFGSIEDYAPVISQRMDELLEQSGQPHCLVVCHSMGGLATRHLMRDDSERHKVAGVITLGTPHSGTRLASLALGSNGKQMRPPSAWLEQLYRDETDYSLPRIEVLIGTHDNIVSPQEYAAFDGATNTYMCGISHLAMALNDNVIDWTLERCARLSDQHSQSRPFASATD